MLVQQAQPPAVQKFIHQTFQDADEMAEALRFPCRITLIAVTFGVGGIIGPYIGAKFHKLCLWAAMHRLGYQASRLTQTVRPAKAKSLHYCRVGLRLGHTLRTIKFSEDSMELKSPFSDHLDRGGIYSAALFSFWRNSKQRSIFFVRNISAPLRTV
jgi:hypothetical protein